MNHVIRSSRAKVIIRTVIKLWNAAIGRDCWGRAGERTSANPENNGGWRLPTGEISEGEGVAFAWQPGKSNDQSISSPPLSSLLVSSPAHFSPLLSCPLLPSPLLSSTPLFSLLPSLLLHSSPLRSPDLLLSSLLFSSPYSSPPFLPSPHSLNPPVLDCKPKTT